MSDKLNIEQLVSSKLGEAEITPSLGAWKGIHRKLRWRQFLRFNPGQFNAYYLAGFVVSATGLIVILSTNPAFPEPADTIETSPSISKEISPPQNLSESEKPITAKPEPEPEIEQGLETSPDPGEAIPEFESSDNSDTVTVSQPLMEDEVQTEIPGIVLPIQTVEEDPGKEDQSE